MILRLTVVAAAVALLAPPAAFAHAFLVRSEPSAQATVRVAPSRVLLVFDEGVSPSRIDVTGTNGASVLGGKPHTVKGAQNEIVVPLRPNLPNGGYVVHWSEVDVDDGHLISGVFGFGVGEAAPAVHSSSGSNFRLGDAVGRWLMLLGLLVAAGLVVFRRVVLRGVSTRRLDAVAAFAAAVAACGAAILLAREPGPLTTRFDRTTLAGAIVAALAACIGFAALRLRRLRPLAEVGMLALLALPTLDGHAIAPGVNHFLSVPSDLVHVAAASVWIGGVLALVALVPAEEAHAAVRRFAPLALAAVAALALTGVLRALSELRSVSQLVTTSYGETILVKSVLFASLVAAAALARGRPRRPGLAVEAGLLFTLVAAVAVLVGLRPGRDVPRAAAAQPAAAFVTAAEAGTYAVGVALVPASADVDATATVLGIEGPASGLDVAFQTGGKRVVASPCGAGCYRASLPVEVPRDLSVEVRRPGARPAHAKLVVPQLWPAPSGAEILGEVNRVFRSLRTLTVISRLASTPTNATTTIYRMAAPNRLSGVEEGTGAAEVIIGAKRWDRDSATSPWQESPAFPVRQPSLPWPPAVRDVHIVGQGVVAGSPVWILSFVDPRTPAWFRIAVDKRTARTLSMDMIATAHFMHEDYRRFDQPTPVRPPR